MLRRTKEMMDKEGRPMLALPPTDIKSIECEQSEAERDFHDALLKRSKVQFDQFVAQGKALHDYASIHYRAYVEELVGGIRGDENAGCPICLESADDPVLTPCAHQMCGSVFFQVGGPQPPDYAQFAGSWIRCSGSGEKIIDPWWNPAVKEQAIMRIHCIGQKRTVCVRRFIVKVQARNQRMIAGALSDEEVRTARIEEPKILFR
ncbi:Zinc finger, C3HC4 RING-type [Dillenia turbinata]|uniref:Zinc finger, C3HC4 RING-type n=1 Tax=Dillenia turbinata TaxID=194707 RepID=A0AAN8YSW3_9MAGN